MCPHDTAGVTWQSQDAATHSRLYTTLSSLDRNTMHRTAVVNRHVITRGLSRNETRVLAGVVALWDVGTGQQLAEYEAHEKRIWTVDFCHTDPMHFISGSDDGWVKARARVPLTESAV